MGRRLSSGEMMRGVFIKHISPDSPAAQHGSLQTGDRILEVCACEPVRARVYGNSNERVNEQVTPWCGGLRHRLRVCVPVHVPDKLRILARCEKKKKRHRRFSAAHCVRTACTACMACVAGNDNEVMITPNYLRNKNEDPNTVKELNRAHLVLVNLEYGERSGSLKHDGDVF